MSSNYSQIFIVNTRCVDALCKAKIGRTPGFILCEPPVNTITQALRNYLSIFCESVSGITNEPTPLILQSHGQIPVVKCSEGTNTSSEQSINQAVIKIQSAFIDGAGSVWEDTWPGERETIGIQVEFGHERDIFFHAMIMICSKLTCLPPICRSWYCRKAVPHRKAASVFMHCPFNLIG